MATITTNESKTIATYENSSDGKTIEKYTFYVRNIGYFLPSNEKNLRVSTIGGEVLLAFENESQRDEAVEFISSLL